MKLSLYPPATFLALLCFGIGMVSVAVALIVAGSLLLAAWLVFAAHKAGRL